MMERFKKGDLRALSRFITLAENKDPSVPSLLQALYAQTGKAHVVGITGAPGAGKSTLTDKFIHRLRKEKRTVGVVAVDPVSPFTGGALLGDRIRLVDHFNDPGVFIRSLSTRGKLGGLSLATREVVHLLDAFGHEFVLVETVGVGQSEVDVREIADVTVVVLVPEWGDGIQTIKSGILEIGDIFVVNKSDREGADRLVNELKASLQIEGRAQVPILATSIHDVPSLDVLFSTIQGFLTSSGELIARRRAQRARETVSELLLDLVTSEARNWVAANMKDAKNPYSFIQDFRKLHPEGSLFRK
jgi:LAO/AO transport system kinase